MTNVVELKNIRFERGGKPILRDVTWTIKAGEHWALVGANGSGKTTLLKILTGYEWGSAGSVNVLGREYGKCDLRALRKAIGWVSASLDERLPAQDTALEVVVSGIEASLGIYRHFSDADWDRARAALDALNGSQFAQQPFETLSQGEQQRTLIARALVNEPGVLVLDEPCAGLDPAARAHFLSDLARLATSENTPTIVMVTHHVEEIGAWIGHVHVLKDGATLRQGRIEEILTGEVLSDAFSTRCTLERGGHTYTLRIEEGSARPHISP